MSTEPLVSAVLHLLESGALRLSEEVRAGASAEFSANRRLNRYVSSERSSSLEEFLEITGNGRAPGDGAGLTCLGKERARAA